MTARRTSSGLSGGDGSRRGFSAATPDDSRSSKDSLARMRSLAYWSQSSKPRSMGPQSSFESLAWCALLHGRVVDFKFIPYRYPLKRSRTASDTLACVSSYIDITLINHLS